MTNEQIQCQCFPNPFNPAIQFCYEISERLPVKLTIYNLQGQNVYTTNEGLKDAGSYTLRWYSSDNYGNPLPGGVYFYRLQTGSIQKTGKITLLR